MALKKKKEEVEGSLVAEEKGPVSDGVVPVEKAKTCPKCGKVGQDEQECPVCESTLVGFE